ncbi:MAG: acyl-CoA dehydrogenase family protein [Gammaproteobacteria bacterium]
MLTYPNFDSLYSPDHTLKLFRDTVKDFVVKEIIPLASEIDVLNDFPIPLWKNLGSMGLLGITVAEKFNGINCGYLEHVIVMEEISRGSASVGLSYAAHSNLCINQLVRFGNEDQKQKYLPKLVSGEWIGALAISESNAGSDALNMELTANKSSDNLDFILNGRKMWITNGSEADVIIVYAKTNKAAGSKGITAFIIATNDLDGFYRTKKLDKLGMRGSNTCELIFNNCSVSSKNILHKENAGIEVLMGGLNYERLILAAGPIGIMQACLDLVLPYIRQRKQFGKSLGEFQLIQSKIADLYTALNASRAYLYNLAKLADDYQQLSNQDAASILLFTAEQAVKVALDTIQILGANGYCNDCIAGRLLRDAKLYEIGGGTSEIRRIIIGKELYNPR